MEKALVFNIERFATEDGDGIRTVVFLKGCTLRCKWCSNPESQRFDADILFHEHLCTGCKTCLEICPGGAVRFIEGFGFITDHDKCNGCGQCVESCLYNARTLSGEEKNSDELVDILLKDEEYYHSSGGGVTFSGGEPLFSSTFIKEVSGKLKKRNIHTLVETCGQVSTNHFKEVLSSIDAIYFDIKHMDPKVHKLLTGHDNQLIMNNLSFVNDNFSGHLSVRYPVIPGTNDSLEDIDHFVDMIVKMDNVDEIVFLPYHRLALSKYKGLGRKYPMEDVSALEKSYLYRLATRYKGCGKNVKIQ